MPAQLSTSLLKAFDQRMSTLVPAVVRDNGTFLCKYQENHLSILWTVGIFALNFGPVFVGPVLDYFGPKLTVILGEWACCHTCTELTAS